ncbi:MAG: monovalent cation/H+ antiporter subunit D family protein [Candidatus Omnitrophica bacterium]|nr:monovalent cation/H+ antiporter subunit D family protein [Candidatus Omnitrophota bacterium]
MPVFVAVPLLTAFLSVILGKIKEKYVKYLAVLAGMVLFVYALISTLWIKNGPKIYPMGGWEPPFGICLELDALSVLLLIVINFIGLMAIMYSWDYIEKRFNNEGFYYSLFFLLLTGLNGVVLSGDIFNIFVFLEIASIASYALVAFGVEAEELEASFKYLVLGSIASMFILLAIAMIWGSTSTLNMADVARYLSLSENSRIIMFALALFIMGFGLKAGLVPFHTWLPDAHPSAPAPVSAMLSGVVIKTLGIYALVRIAFNIVGITSKISSIFMWLGIISMSIGVILAIGQWDFKRLLAYHSISQIGYVIFGIGLGSPLGIVGGLFHLFNHSLFKSLLFLNAGAVEYATGSRRLEELGGLAHKMLFTSTTSLIASLSIAGIPPFCGFWSKLIIIIAAIEAKNIFGAGVCILVSLITLASFLKVQTYAFLRSAKDKSGVKEVGRSLLFPMGILALSCILVGLFFAPLIKFIIEPAKDVLISGRDYIFWILGK